MFKGGRTLRFSKLHGIGNDYIFFNCTEGDISDPSALAIRLSDRHTSVGGDGIVLILPSTVADLKMRMFNADGSEGRMCGNAARCVGKYAYEHGLANNTELTLETLSGIRTLSLELSAGRVTGVTVDMGAPCFDASAVPAISDAPELIYHELCLGDICEKITALSVGNPHCIIFKDEIDSLELSLLGPKFEHASIFPDRVNTEFVRVISETELSMRVWERGSGETLACGTGACAAVAAAVRLGISPRGEFIKVVLRGGELYIKYTHDGRLLMRGPAEHAFDGEVEI